MKRVITILSLLHSAFLSAQVKLPVYPDSNFSAYYHQRHTLFQSLPQTRNDIIFIGNSITDGNEWSEMFGDLRIKNRGISGDITAGVVKRLDEVVKRKPASVFLMIGTNDLARNISPDSVVRNILRIAAYMSQECPTSKLFVQSILPVNDVFGKFSGHTSKSVQIKEVNKRLFDSASALQYAFIDLYTSFCDKQGKLEAGLTNDGLHLSGAGYILWKHLVFPHVYGLQEKPSLIPLPQQLKWKSGFFSLLGCRFIVVKGDSLENEAGILKKAIEAFGWDVDIKTVIPGSERHIELRIEKSGVFSSNKEAYGLKVSTDKILITATTSHGIFNGIQTLRHLMRDGVMVDACDITDWPAFSWRGYMIDVGRNYMSMKLLKQQIDVMAANKLNIFHFHATEDIAWRIASKQFPQLNAPEHMLRNKGMYYNEAEIKELITYCKERHIVFVPEIDMPGHSAAFRRAMKTDMQSDTGLILVKSILKEFCTTYDVPYIHIGADEVKIVNKQFIPEVTSYIEGFGRKVIGWQPGGNFSNSTIRQLWMDDNAHHTAGSEIQFIDSRHLYLNHMDPLEAVTTIFNRKIADKEKGDESTLGGTICMWHDRAVSKEDDILNMNPVYPGMLAFAERSWKGGGVSGWVANISNGDEDAFAEFESRLLDNKQLYFKDKPFGYVKQSGMQWKLYGPFDNGGDVHKKFFPEIQSAEPVKKQPYKQVTGGTIVLRHWWAPLIKGAIEEPKENTTWYASTNIWMDGAGERECWIGFNNLSRSPATDSPPAGAWDEKGSTIWVNGNLMPPPVWLRGGQRGNAEVPLMDEGYEYREPVKIYFQNGWNTVLIKAPVTTFKGKNWQNPVKWMFTFVLK